MRRAVIDIGSNTLLLLIVDEHAGQLTRVLDWCRFGRLGQGLDRTGQLHPDAIARSLDICREYRAALDEHAVAQVDVVATQSLREAHNADEFAGPAAAILRAPIQVIAGEREAELAFLAAARSLPDLAGQPFVVADVGGGSTEVIVTDGARVVSAVSVPIGAVRMTERHLRGDPPTADERAALTADIDDHYARFTPELPRGVALVASAGTATTLASLDLAAAYDPDRVHGHRLAPATLTALTARLLDTPLADRRALPGMEPRRADVMPAGTAIFARLAARLDAPAIVISDRGIRWGLAYATIKG
jgi:exopolyphosphatase/guanosine-5'-triphosphate,3'-diphosphate pyrophosphatase